MILESNVNIYKHTAEKLETNVGFLSIEMKLLTESVGSQKLCLRHCIKI